MHHCLISYHINIKKYMTLWHKKQKNKIQIKKIVVNRFFPILLFLARIEINHPCMNNVYNDYAVAR